MGKTVRVPGKLYFFTFLLKKKHSRVLVQPVFDLIEEFRFLGEFFIYIDAGFPGWELEWFHTQLGQSNTYRLTLSILLKDTRYFQGRKFSKMIFFA